MYVVNFGVVLPLTLGLEAVPKSLSMAPEESVKHPVEDPIKPQSF